MKRAYFKKRKLEDKVYDIKLNLRFKIINKIIYNKIQVNNIKLDNKWEDK